MMSGIVLKLLLLSATKKVGAYMKCILWFWLFVIERGGEMVWCGAAAQVAVYTLARVYGFKNLYRKGLRLSNSTLGKHSQLTTSYKHVAKVESLVLVFMVLGVLARGTRWVLIE